MFNGFKKKGILSILLFISIFSAKAQKLYVFDRQTNLPIKKVFVFNNDRSKTATTDELGTVNLRIFKDEEFINLQHPLYLSQKLSLAKIVKMKYRIGLAKKPIEKDEFIYANDDWFFDKKGIPGKVELINRKDITLKDPTTAIDFLSFANQVYIQKNQQSDGNPMIRGFSANRLLYYVDGVKLNNATFGNEGLSHLFMVDVNSVDHAEIIYGPGNGSFGSGALGGVIEMRLVEPQLSKNQSWTTTGTGIAGISSAEFEKSLHADINFSNNKWALLVALSYNDFDDLKMGNNHNDYARRPEYATRINEVDTIVKNSNPDIQKFSAFNTLSFISKVKQQFTPNVDWTLSYYLTQTSSVPRYDKLLEYSDETLKYAENYIKPQQWMMNSLEINFNEPTKLYDKSNFVAAYQNYKEGINERVYKNAWLEKHSENVNTFSANLDFQKTVRWNNIFWYGIEFTYTNVDSNGEKKNIDTGGAAWLNSRYADRNNNQSEAGIYSNYQKVFDKIPLTISSGLRVSYVGLKSVFGDSSIFQHPGHIINVRNIAIKANAGIAYHPNNWQVKFNLSSGFRSPDLEDVTRIYSPEPGRVVIPNENLKPEYLYNVDLGIQYHLSNLFIIDFTAFFSYLDHAMVVGSFELNGQDSILYNGVKSKIQAMINSRNAIVYGTSLNFEWQIFQQLKFMQSVNLIISKDNKGLTLPDTPPLYGTSALIFEQNNFKLMISATYNPNLTYDKLPPNERNRAYLYATDSDGNPYSPSWWIISFNANYTFADNFIVNAGVENILNYRYRPYSWGITAPGRNFKISIRYNF